MVERKKKKSKKPGRNRITILGIRKSEYPDFRIRIDPIFDFEHPLLKS